MTDKRTFRDGDAGDLPADAGVVRGYGVKDRAAVLTLNAANQPEVGPMDEDKLAWFIESAPFYRIVEVEGAVEGFLIGLTDATAGYESPNYRWFADRYESFAYVDRIALSPTIRGQGWGPQLYGDFESWARASSKPVLAAEVNTVPPNPRSLRFHALFGFAEVGRCQPYGSNAEVAMMAKPLS